MIDVAHYADAEALGTWIWPHFSPGELADRESGALRFDPAFLDWLEGVRKAFGRPMLISSGYREPVHQWRLTGRRTGAHVDGQAVDVLVSGRDAYDLMHLALEYGVRGLGVRQIGPEKGRFLHLDCWTAIGAPRPMCWSY